MTLVDFLLTRIGEDESAQRDPHGSDAVHTNDCSIHPQGMEETWCDCGQPEFVLAECEAKRRIVALHGPANLDDDGTVSPYSDATDALHCKGCNANFVEEYAALLDECPTKRLLAMPYADHPDYDQAWKP